MSKNLFLSFGDGRQGFKYAGQRLCREVSVSGWNSDQILLDSDTGSRLIGAEWDLHQNWMTQTKRGFGLWVWKPLIIKHALLGTFGDYDRVFYLDAGSQFSLKTVHARERFDQYLELADLSGGFAFTHIDGQSGIDDFSDEAWGKHELHKALDPKGDVLKTNQILAGCLILTRESIDVVANWMNWSTKEDYFFLRDPSEASFQSSNFVAHRHDQSILSLLWKNSNFALLPDETWFAPDWADEAREFPIWTIRNSSSIKSPAQSGVAKLCQQIQINYSRVYDKINGY
jgi:hypothetical protein